jgi:cyclic-di-AMP phosphodiesterase PgpH
MLREPHERPSPFGRRDAVRLVAAAVLIAAALAAGVATDLTTTRPGYAAGTIAQTVIRAPRDATIPDTAATTQAQDAAAAQVAPVYEFIQSRADNLASLQVSTLQTDLIPVDDAFRTGKTTDARNAALQTALPSLSAVAMATLQGLDPARWPAVEQAAVQLLGSAERVQIKSVAEVPTIVASQMPAGLSRSEQQLVTELVSPLVTVNSTVSTTLTKQAQDRARADPANNRVYNLQSGQVVVDQGHVITASDMVIISFFGLDKSTVGWGNAAAWILLGTVVAALLLGWLWRFRPEYWHRTQTLLLVGLIFVVSVLAVKLPGGRAWLPYVIPTAASGMLLTLLLDSGVGIVMVALLAVLAGPVSGSSIELSAYVFLGGFAGILAIRKGERQHFFVQAGLAVAVTDIAVVGTFGLLGSHDMTGMLQLAGAAGAGALIATVLTLGTFSLLGNLFGILTPSQLLELANPSQPLLRRLLIETPGTYHHSLMVGNLAERAASAIGADPLLARAAAYYHDIGKLANPLAFIENQASGENIHDQLEPEDSATILKQHVADGIDLAYKARLPKPLIAFIPQHHGTAIMGYVYGRAREAAARPYGGQGTRAGKTAADAVDQRRFRHGGPKPQLREAAILMLSDGVEASVRSLSSRDEATIRAMVSQIIQERLSDGQLNECDLTIRDLENIREAFVGQLLGMYHQRIAYPQNKVVELESRREKGLG